MPIVQNRTTGQVPSYFFPPGALLRGFASGSSGDRVKPGDLDEAPLRLGPLSAASFASRNAFKRTVLARSAWRSALYSDIALAPSAARSAFLNLASAALRSLSSVMACSCNLSDMFSQHRQADKRYLGVDWGHRTRFAASSDLPKIVFTLEAVLDI